MFLIKIFLFFLIFISFSVKAFDFQNYESYTFNKINNIKSSSVIFSGFNHGDFYDIGNSFSFLGIKNLSPVNFEKNDIKINEIPKNNNGYLTEVNLVRDGKKKNGEFLFDIVRCVPAEQRHIMSKIVKHESSGNPLAVNINRVKRQLRYVPKNNLEASILVDTLVKMGLSVDIGYAQINSQHLKPNGFLGKMNAKVEDLFDPCVNLLAGAVVYQQAYNQYRDVGKALSVYNTGNPVDGFRNGYVYKVLSK